MDGKLVIAANVSLTNYGTIDLSSILSFENNGTFTNGERGKLLLNGNPYPLPKPPVKEP